MYAKQSKTKRALSSLALIFAFTASSYAVATTSAYRNGDKLDISQSGGAQSILVINTYPPKPYQPVYAWRQHRTHTGSGSLGYNGDIIGYTDSNGSLIFNVRIPNDSIYCGEFLNERFAVGSATMPMSTPLNFQIYRQIDFGPAETVCLEY